MRLLWKIFVAPQSIPLLLITLIALYSTLLQCSQLKPVATERAFSYLQTADDLQAP